MVNGANPWKSSAVKNLQVNRLFKSLVLSRSGSESILAVMAVKPKSENIPTNCKKPAAVTYQPNFSIPKARVIMPTAASASPVLMVLPTIWIIVFLAISFLVVITILSIPAISTSSKFLIKTVSKFDFFHLFYFFQNNYPQVRFFCSKLAVFVL